MWGDFIEYIYPVNPMIKKNVALQEGSDLMLHMSDKKQIQIFMTSIDNQVFCFAFCLVKPDPIALIQTFCTARIALSQTICTKTIGKKAYINV